MTQPEIPPPLELQCLKALWRLERGSVQQVRESMSGTRPLAYTTVMTLLDRLNKRGVVERHKHGRRFLYSPAVSREAVRRQAVDGLIADLFDGAAGDLMDFLVVERREQHKPDLRAGALDATLL